MSRKGLARIIGLVLILIQLAACQDSTQNPGLIKTKTNPATSQVEETILIPTETSQPVTQPTQVPTEFDPMSLLTGKLFILSYFYSDDSAIYEFSREDGIREILITPYIWQYVVSNERQQMVYYKLDYDNEKFMVNLLDLGTLESTNLDQWGMDCPSPGHGVSGDERVGWSFDQDKVVYETCQTGKFEIFSRDLENGQTVNITLHDSSDFSPSVSPTGDQIAFLSDRTGTDQLYLVRTDGSELLQMTDLKEDGVFANIVWSPDGTRIAFQYSYEYPREIYVINLDGTNLTQLTTSTWYQTNTGSGIPWSPSGQQILFTGKVNNISQMFMVDVETLEVTQLTSGDENKYSPAWSPDGDAIVFAAGTIGAYRLYYLDLEGELGLQLIPSIVLDSANRIIWVP